MNDKAKKLIEEAFEKKGTFLNLSNCELKEIPPEISKMTWLKKLNLSHNQIQEIKGFGNISNLQTLLFSHNQIIEIKGLYNLINLKLLDLQNNQIKSIKGVGNLCMLQALYLQRNQIQNIEGFNNLSSLRVLELQNNQIQNIKGLNNLPNLQSLELSYNQIKDIRGLNHLSNLQSLSLGNNQIKIIKGLDKLSNLQSIELHSNFISKTNGLEKLNKLSQIGLANNQITNISELNNISNIKAVNIARNPLTKFSSSINFKGIRSLNLAKSNIRSLFPLEKEILAENKVLNQFPSVSLPSKNSKSNVSIFDKGKKTTITTGIFVKECYHLKEPALEWILLGSEMVKSYFQAIEEQGKEEINEVKVLLIGDGGAGKTSLAYRLAHPRRKLPTEDKRTRGIDVHDWKFTKNGKKYIVHLWDFGGQVMYDMVHQYFYSQRALYLLLDSSRSGANENDSRLNQLLQSAELFGRNSPMIMVQNEHTGHEKKMDFGTLQKNYPFLEEFRKVNLSSKEGLDDMKNLLKRYIEKIPSVGQVLPKKWLWVREKIEALPKDKSTMSLQEFRQLCKESEIKDVKGQNLLSRYFHQLGVFLHFQDKKTSSLSKLIILNREWATKASYKVFDAAIMQKGEQKGSFSEADLEYFWPEPEFIDFHSELLDLMMEFEICFELKDTKRYLVPRMMDKMGDTDYCAGAERPLHFYYEYTFMPEGLLNRLSVRLHDMIGGENGDMVWSDGVFFEDKGIKAELREIRQPDTNRIQIKIIGPDAHFMSEKLIREIDKINDVFNLERLKVTTNIPCVCAECLKSDKPYFYDFRKVKKDLQNPDPKFHWNLCDISRKEVKYHDLLKTISHKALEEAVKIQKEKKIGQFGEHEISFKGEEAVGFAKNLIANKKDIQAVGQTVKKEGTKTRKTVKAEAILTREELGEKLADIPERFHVAIKASQAEILTELLGKFDTLALDHTHTHDLIKIIGEGIDNLFYTAKDNGELLTAFGEAAKMRQKDDLALTEKLKVSLWLIPTILKYEKELSGNILQELKAKWKTGGFKRIFFEDDGK